MLSTHQIERWFRSGQFATMLTAALGYLGPSAAVSAPVRRRLARSSVPAVALGLRRLVAMSYGPTELSGQMLEHLLDRQRADGSFDGDAWATAAAAAALETVLAEPLFAEPRLRVAHARAVAALADMQQDDGLLADATDAAQEDRARTAAFVLAMLASSPAFRRAVRLEHLVAGLQRRQVGMAADTRTLWRLAQAQQPTAAAALANFRRRLAAA
jgi:hypothetical protein